MAAGRYTSLIDDGSGVAKDIPGGDAARSERLDNERSTGMAVLGTAAAGTLVDDSGKLLVTIGRPVELTHLFAVLATEGPQRHTRAANQRRARVYRVSVNLARREEVEALAAALALSFGGTLPVRYRHPRDDASDGSYRVANAAEAGLAVQRSRGGLSGSFTLVLEGLGGVTPAGDGW